MLLHHPATASLPAVVASRGMLAPRAALVLLATASASATPGDSRNPTQQQQQLPTDQYFDEYGSLYDHIGMLQDHQRMSAYHDAIKMNAKQHFEGKVVLDVGTGTGVLSIWAAQAGAKHVYAIEATNVAAHAERLIAAHGLSDRITVLKGRMEQIELPEKVDVLLSEWMGYFLLREAMVNSVIDARDKYLKPVRRSTQLLHRTGPCHAAARAHACTRLSPSGAAAPSSPASAHASMARPWL